MLSPTSSIDTEICVDADWVALTASRTTSAEVALSAIRLMVEADARFRVLIRIW